MRPKPLFACALCQCKHGRKDSLRNHLKDHVHNLEDKKKKKFHECPVCGSAYGSPVQLEMHNKVHEQEKTCTNVTREIFDCPQCNRTFSSETSLRKHTKIHSGSIISQFSIFMLPLHKYSHACGRFLYEDNKPNKGVVLKLRLAVILEKKSSEKCITTACNRCRLVHHQPCNFYLTEMPSESSPLRQLVHRHRAMMKPAR